MALEQRNSTISLSLNIGFQIKAEMMLSREVAVENLYILLLPLTNFKPR
jgi:hypothetical protein